MNLSSETMANAAMRRWWDSDVIEHRVSGVFEGGGAKGVLYTGALEGMVDERCWFEAVVGASAGAITATLVAAGLRPEQINKRMWRALATLRMPTAVNGALRVRDGASYLDQDALLGWLQRMLEASFRLFAGTRGGAGATFSDLYQLTGIELHVVAADLNRHQLVVFNHELTPNCQVAEAVVASAAIPFVYEWMWLDIPDRRDGMIVDGGIAANFPSFVFNDRSFRQWAGLAQLPDDSVVVGFLLDESATASRDAPDIYCESVFRPERGASRGRRFKAARQPGPPSATSRVVAAVTLPFRVLLWPFAQFVFNWFPRFLARNGRGRSLAFAADPGWLSAGPAKKAPKRGLGNRIARGFLPWFDRILIGIRPVLIFCAGLIIVTLALGSGLYHYGWQPLVSNFDDAFHSRVSILGAVVGTVFFVGVMSAAIYAWVVLVVVFTAATFAHASLRMTGYDLARTFLQGPGAPPWAGNHESDHVIRLNVPCGITTLKVAVSDDELRTARDAARAETRSQIQAIMASAARPEGVDPE